MSRAEKRKGKVQMGKSSMDRVAWDRASCSYQTASKQDGDSLRLAGRELYAIQLHAAVYMEKSNPGAMKSPGKYLPSNASQSQRAKTSVKKE